MWNARCEAVHMLGRMHHKLLLSLALRSCQGHMQEVQLPKVTACGVQKLRACQSDGHPTIHHVCLQETLTSHFVKANPRTAAILKESMSMLYHLRLLPLLPC